MTALDRNFRLSRDVLPKRYELAYRLDLDTWASTASEKITVTLKRPASEIVLHAVELDITSAAVDGSNQLASKTAHDEAQAVTLRFAKEIPAGEHTVEIAWTGGIRDSLRGLYRSIRGEERYAATQFEAADARRAFPCFDEPEFKATFALELTHPSGNAAIANMPVSSQEDLPDGWTRTRFRETPKISTYLVAFTVGPYESTPESTSASGIPVRVWLPPGLAAQGVFARDAHVRSVDWLQGYTAIPYPYIKVDAIGIPDFEAGAMENPGAITYRTRLLAADERNASIVTMKGIFSTAAHELTHMWWGDLVTMRWWTDLWLNESFASFVGEKCTATLNPEWGYWRDFVAQNTGAFNLDALASTHPISVEAKNAEEASERFDAITYEKGAAVLRMIESFLGEDDFRKGVRIYLDRHREANASADDFWHALDEASGQDVTGIMNAWIKESGHPLVGVEVREENGGLAFDLSQTRYYSDPDMPPSAQRWPVPLVVKYGTADGVREERFLLREERATLRLPGARWVYPNAGGRGFYRWMLDDIGERMLDAGVRELAPEERLSLVDDAWALTRSGRMTLATFLRRLDSMSGEQDRAVISAISDALTWISHYAVRDRTQGAFARFIEDFYRPILAEVGMRPKAREDTDTREKRGRVIAMLGFHARAADVRREARAAVTRHLDGDERLSPDIAGVIAGVAATDGDAALWERYVKRMQQAQQSDAQEEARFRQSLISFEDPVLAERTAETIFSPLIRTQDRGLMVLPLLLGRATRAAGWTAIKAHWQNDIATAEPLLKQRFVNAVGQMSTREYRDEATRFLEAKRTSDIAEAVKQSVERLRINTAAAERLADELDAALAAPSRR